MRDEELTSEAFLGVVSGVVGGALCGLLVSWAVAYDRLGVTGATLALALVACSAVGVVYARRRGDSEWEATELSRDDAALRR